jgi:hypothetical protein
MAWEIRVDPQRIDMKILKISPRNTLRVATVFIGICFFYGQIYIHDLVNKDYQNFYSIAWFVFIMILSAVMYFIKCPSCKSALVNQKSSKYLWMNGGYLFSAPCKRCGYDLDKVE